VDQPLVPPAGRHNPGRAVAPLLDMNGVHCDRFPPGGLSPGGQAVQEDPDLGVSLIDSFTWLGRRTRSPGSPLHHGRDL
jgi:hypothetical protein